ncbi:phage major capsid protein [Cryobacterium sp. Y62]|uniref:phage major capsid protein n=1 Tax=Cryobacterium sp. Y62 TaxID=2048284 RepID=UPI000CE37DAE|nr:phage major capsid protein [Cryobacterium sp. Y62]
MATTLSNVPAGLLPTTIAAPIFDKARELSGVQQLARRVPLALSANTSVPVSMDIPAAGWVSEGGVKPTGAASVGIKQMQGKKVALLVPVSEEIARTNPAGLYDQLQQDLPIAIARSFDYAAIHGLDLRTGGAGPFADYLKKGATSIELGTAAASAGGMYADLVNGEKAVTDAGFDFTGFAADPRLKPVLKLNVDTTGRPLWVDSPADGLTGASLIGYPATYNRGVSGVYRNSGNRVQVATITGSPTGGTFTLSGNGATTTAIAYNATGATVQTALRLLGGSFAQVTVAGSAGGPYTITLSAGAAAPAPLTAAGALTGGTSPAIAVTQSAPTDTNLRAIGGDWSQAAWGSGMDITIKVSDSASYVDEAGVTHSAFQENLVLLLVEAHYGFVKSDASAAWVAYTDAS